MSTVDSVLFKLLAIGLGQDVSFDLPLGEIDWPALIQRAMAQGLDAVAFDGVQALYERRPELAEALDASLGEAKFEWLGLTLQAEQDYAAYRGKLRDLAAFYQAAGMRMLVLKGYGLSLDYPVPSHRPTGDIDIYLFGRGKEADDLVKAELGLDIQQNNDRHSVFSFKGLSIENHAHFLDEVGHPSLKGIESFLEQEVLKAEAVSMEGVSVFVPTVMMNAVFLPCHMATHFVFGGMMLKQLVDWAVFLGRHGTSVDWSVVKTFAEEAGRFELFRAFNGIVAEHFGVPEACLPDWGRDRALEERIWQDTLRPRKDKSSRNLWDKFTDYLAARWKYRLAYRESFFLNFFRRGWASFRGRHLPHSRSVWE